MELLIQECWKRENVGKNAGENAEENIGENAWENATCHPVPSRAQFHHWTET